MNDLPSIPVVDVRDGGLLRHASEGRDRARGLRDACVAWFPKAARPLVPLLDSVARRWLMRSQSPYVEEVRAIAAFNPMLTLEFTAHGGHVGFVGGSVPWRPFYYGEWRACQFLGAQLALARADLVR